MKKKNNKLNLILCAAAFCIMIGYMLFVDGFDNILNALSRIDVLFLFIAVLFMVIYWLCEAVSLHIITKVVNPKQRLRDTLTVTMIGQYFNCITPFASGGQPVQAYYLMKYGCTLGGGVTALLCRFIIYQFVLTAYSVVVLVAKFSFFSNEYSTFMLLTLIGFIVNAAVILGLLMLAFFKRPTVALAHGCIKLMCKLKIFKNYDERITMVDEEIEKLSANFKFIKTQPIMVIKMVILTVFQLTVYFGISYIIYLGFNLSGSDFFTIISCQAFVLMISSFVPLPGALGAAEGCYGAFFGPIFGERLVSVSTFIWRFLTFYLPIIVGLVLTFFLDRGESKKCQVKEKE